MSVEFDQGTAIHVDGPHRSRQTVETDQFRALLINNDILVCIFSF